MESPDFARVFGAALDRFLRESGISQTQAVKALGLELNKGKARINTYCRGRSDGTWPVPDAEILYLLCTKLGFSFDYQGYTITATSFNGSGPRRNERPLEQLSIHFDGQFNLTDQDGAVLIDVKRPPGRIDVTLSLQGKGVVG